MFAEDSVWCCILPTHCAQPSATSRYFNEYWKDILTVSGVALVTFAAIYYAFRKRSRKRDKRKSPERMEGLSDEKRTNYSATAALTMADGEGDYKMFFVNKSFTRLMSYVKDMAANQATKCCTDRPFQRPVETSSRTTLGTRNPTVRNGELPAAVVSGSLMEIHKAVDEFIEVTDQLELRSGERIQNAETGLVVSANIAPLVKSPSFAKSPSPPVSQIPTKSSPSPSASQIPTKLSPSPSVSQIPTKSSPSQIPTKSSPSPSASQIPTKSSPSSPPMSPSDRLALPSPPSQPQPSLPLVHQSSSHSEVLTQKSHPAVH